MTPEQIEAHDQIEGDHDHRGDAHAGHPPRGDPNRHPAMTDTPKQLTCAAVLIAASEERLAIGWVVEDRPENGAQSGAYAQRNHVRHRRTSVWRPLLRRPAGGTLNE
jgi:hypothetical protein